MSKLTITYLNNSVNTYDVTGITVNVMEKLISIEKQSKIYIPLCNIKSIKIEGANQTKEV